MISDDKIIHDHQPPFTIIFSQNWNKEKFQSTIKNDMKEKFYLCQPGNHGFSLPSCASCCGIYNYSGHNRKMITETLEMQTKMMDGWDKTDEDIERIRDEVENKRPKKRFSVIYNCPFSGFINDDHTMIGCLLHPMKLEKDLRDYCQYGRKTCQEAKCTAYTYLSDDEANAVMASCKDWYLYTMTITDTEFIRGFFKLCEQKLLAPLKTERIANEEKLARPFFNYLSLKENWPFETDPERYGKYYFVEKQYRIYKIDYDKLGLKKPDCHKIILALGSVIESKNDLEKAVEIINEKVDGFLGVY
jgi:hypothetical protein